MTPQRSKVRPSRILAEASRVVGRDLSWFERVGSRLDDALAVIAPRTALRRQTARARAALFRQAYPGASRGRLHEDWTPIRTSADGALLEDLPELRARARDLMRGDAHAAALIRTLEDNIVGTGIRPQARATAADTGLTEAQVDEWNRACERVFNDWAKREADATGHSSFWDLQRQVLRSIKADGEALVHPIMIPSDAGPRRLQLALEVIEPERLADPSGVGGSVLPKRLTERIRGGVEIGSRSQAIAYWIADGNPDDPVRYPRVTWQRVRRYRDGRLNLLHIFRREMPGQHRGVPILAPVLLSFRTLAKYLEAELTAARVAACIAAFVRRSGIGEEVPPGFETAGQGADRVVLERLEPGVIEYLDPGEEIQTFSVNRPGTTFDPFVTRILRGIAAAVGLPYELLVRDFSRTNYSSMRAALLETRRGFRADQGQLIDQFCQPVYELVMEEAYLMGLLPRVPGWNERREAFLRTRWVPPAWGWVDPVKEIQASRDAVQSGLSTLADEAAHNGQAWDDIATARAAELRRLRELERQNDLPEGALSGLVQGVVPGATAAPSEEDSEDTGDESDQPDDEETES